MHMSMAKPRGLIDYNRVWGSCLLPDASRGQGWHPSLISGSPADLTSRLLRQKKTFEWLPAAFEAEGVLTTLCGLENVR